MPQSFLYVLYNADGSVMGKLRYGYRKVTCPEDSEQVCPACDITHGGLSLNETPSWTAAKAEVESCAGVKVIQWHRDELSSEVSHVAWRAVSGVQAVCPPTIVDVLYT